MTYISVWTLPSKFSAGDLAANRLGFSHTLQQVTTDISTDDESPIINQIRAASGGYAELLSIFFSPTIWIDHGVNACEMISPQR
jgi:hypothetical protein